MTTIKRVFNLETRTLKSKDRCYVGQVYDHISTKMEFSYEPINALTDGYTAYILFDLYDDDGNVFVFGPGSAPRFDGTTFEIPTSITSRIKTQRLDYQIWLIKNRTEWNGRIDELVDTEYLFSSKDSLAFKPSLKCRSPSKDPCRPPQPNMEPGTLGWVNYLRDHCILAPVQYSEGELSDGTLGVTLEFATYNGADDSKVELHIPYLDDEGYLDIHTFLRIVKEYNPDVTHDQIMSALCVQNLLDEKLDKTSVLSGWQDSYAELDVPHASLVKDTLDTKADKDFPIPLWDEAVTYRKSAVVTWEADIYISNVDDNTGKPPTAFPDEWSTITEFDTVIDSYDVPWSDYKDSRRSFSASLQRRHPIAPWDPEVEYGEDSLVIHNGILFISQANSNIGYEPMIQPPVSGMGMDTTLYWAPIRGTGYLEDKDYSTFSYLIGGDNYSNDPTQDGVYKYNIGHGFNTHNLFITTRINHNMPDQSRNDLLDQGIDPSKSYQVDAKYDVTDRTQVKVILSSYWPSNSLVVSISPGGGVNDQSVVSFQPVYEKNQRNGYAGLDDNAKVPADNLPITNAVTGDSAHHVPSVGAVVSEFNKVRVEIDDAVAERTPVVDFGVWDAETIYHEGSVVSYGTKMYISLLKVNKGSIPTDNPKDWREVMTATGDATVARRTVMFGNDTDTEYVVEHGLDSMNLVFSVMRNDDTREYLYPRVFSQDLDHMRVVVDEVPGSNGLVLNIMDCHTRQDIADITTNLFTDPTDRWVFENTTGYPVMVWANGDDGETVEGDIVQSDSTGFNPVTVSFGTDVAGTMTVAKADLVKELNALELDIDLVAEGLDPNRLYVVQVYSIGNTGMAETEIIQILGSGHIKIQTNDADGVEGADVTGYVLLRAATGYVPFTFEQEEVTYFHGLGRVVGIQVFQDNGEVAGTLTSCPDRDNAYAYVRGYSGYMLIV